MGIPTGARRYHSDKRKASRNAAWQQSKAIAADDDRPVCPVCGCHFDPTPDGKHYLIGKIPCGWDKK